jgi:hypothetical protein
LDEEDEEEEDEEKSEDHKEQPHRAKRREYEDSGRWLYSL